MEKESNFKDIDHTLNNILINFVKDCNFAFLMKDYFAYEDINGVNYLKGLNIPEDLEKIERAMTEILVALIEEFLPFKYKILYKCIEFFDIDFYLDNIKIINTKMKFTFNIESKIDIEWTKVKQEFEVDLEKGCDDFDYSTDIFDTWDRCY